jgi:hypothetical protein
MTQKHWTHSEDFVLHVCHATRNNYSLRVGQQCKYCEFAAKDHHIAYKHWDCPFCEFANLDRTDTLTPLCGGCMEEVKWSLALTS